MESNKSVDIIVVKSNPSNFICNDYGCISISEERKLISFVLNKIGILGHEEIDEIIITLETNRKIIYKQYSKITRRK